MASRKTNEMRQRLLEERDALLRQKEAIENQILGLEKAIALIGVEENDKEMQKRGKFSNKAVVLDLLKEVGTTGLNAGTAVAMADSRGITLGRNSVSSMLSRLKRDGVVVYDGERYRLKEFVQTASQATEENAILKLARTQT